MGIETEADIEEWVLTHCKANSISGEETIQQLWSGYGSIRRYRLNGGHYESIILKHVEPPTQNSHPRGWNSDLSHQRKLKSYEVETYWYQNYASACATDCRIPHCLDCETNGSEVFLMMEDLDHAGFPVRKSRVSMEEIQSCLSWLAHFHATFLNQPPKGLWETGTYWHLQTRPEELDVIANTPLGKSAAVIDKRLKDATFQTFVHGDAKLANFCFSSTDNSVAAVDFQYVGGGCGMKDVAYFIGSCLREEDCERYEKQLLDTYFRVLCNALSNKLDSEMISALETEWRDLFPLAWADFHRFLKGWSPGHWKINSYSERLTREVISNI